MLRHLDKDADAVIKLANVIAREFEQEYVGTEHILLALLRHNAGLGAKVLESCGVSEAAVRAKIEELVKRSSEDTWVFGRLPGTPHFRNVMAHAIEEAERLKSNSVGTEHLLLALMREQGSIAQSAMSLLGVSLDKCREKTLAALEDL
jgi:ATP-dependent Clp protease ATP-binding subunit ClpC